MPKNINSNTPGNTNDWIIKCFIDRARTTTALDIRRVQTDDDFKKFEKMGIIDMYQDVFAEEPYKEKFTTDGIRAYSMKSWTLAAFYSPPFKKRKEPHLK